jgi:hypothetical protein
MTETDKNLGASGIGSDLNGCSGPFDVSTTLEILEKTTARLDFEDEGIFNGVGECPESQS